jgi:hydroxypyruvate isomerase
MERHQPESSRHRIHQSVVRWPFQGIPLDAFCKAVAEIGLEGIDVLWPEEYEVPARLVFTVRWLSQVSERTKKSA